MKIYFEDRGDNKTLSYRLMALVFLSAVSTEIGIFRDGLILGNLFVLASSGLIILLALTFGTIQKTPITKTGIALAGYFAVCAVSSLWAPSPVDTLVQVIFLSSAVFGVAQLRDAKTTSAVSMIVKWAVIFALLSFAMAVVFPGMAFQPNDSGRPELRGIFNHQQRLGNFMCVALCLAVLAWLNREPPAQISGKRARFWFITLFIIFLGVFAAFARFYILFAFVAMVITVGLGQKGLKRVLSNLTIFLIAIFTVLYWDGIETLLAGGSVDLTFTGRTRVWERTLQAAQEQPILGYGFASFYNSAFDGLFGLYRPGHAHNSFIQAFFETGWLGLSAILLVVMTQFAIGLMAMGRIRKYSYSLFVTTFCFICGLTGVFYAGKLSLLLVLAFLFSALEANELRVYNKKRRELMAPLATYPTGLSIYKPTANQRQADLATD